MSLIGSMTLTEVMYDKINWPWANGYKQELSFYCVSSSLFEDHLFTYKQSQKSQSKELRSFLCPRFVFSLSPLSIFFGYFPLMPYLPPAGSGLAPEPVVKGKIR